MAATTEGRRARAAFTIMVVSEGVAGEWAAGPQPTPPMSTGRDHGASWAPGQGVVPGLAHTWECPGDARGEYVECQLQEDVQVEAEAQEPQEAQEAAGWPPGWPPGGTAVLNMACRHLAPLGEVDG